MLRFALTFLAIVVVLFAVELAAPVQQALVLPWTRALAHACSSLVTLFDSKVVSYGQVLQSTRNGFAISIESGCNGVEAALILVAAIAAFKSSWKAKIVGIVAGVLAIQALNVVRVVSLFYIGQWNAHAFEWAHLYLWQALIMVDAMVCWLLWLKWVQSGPAPHAPA